jgi:hypothetical protein
MILQRIIVALPALLLGLGLGSCTQVSGSISDHWPHWAGGEPNGLPPRPGTPGYNEFISHGQSGADATTPTGTAGNANPQAAPAAIKPAPDDAVARGGLY